ncbi:unnamed protein product [Medioppia subpectinata]|uniref:Uncharacterized protein n=1 Tax=Medioppia subpectinata TaxID=1979941 RepID=A0A7R9KFI9_9ACAR|nr:unnamed protein product [Medioppia subpectinata]CAG2102422.1 unnamed protein product [Medioppia subpectinata]
MKSHLMKPNVNILEIIFHTILSDDKIQKMRNLFTVLLTLSISADIMCAIGSNVTAQHYILLHLFGYIHDLDPYSLNQSPKNLIFKVRRIT